MFHLIAWLWLPVGVVTAAIAHGGMRLPMEPQAFLSLAVIAPFGLPLAWACRGLHRSGYRLTAWVLFLVLAPLTAAAALFAGLLGPVAILIYAFALSAPAWIIYAFLRRRRRR